jgi:drug/metabolite transporter (DMT)-like permease
VNILLGLTPLVVAILGFFLLNERPTFLQWFGVGFCLIGMFAYFYPVQFPAQQLLWMLIVLVGMLANSFSSVLGRFINRTKALHPLLVTWVSMGIGAAILLVGGIAGQGLPALNLSNWLIIAWLAAVNTAFAFTLWNRTLQDLPAIESTIINSTMLAQIPILAWIFLGESLSVQEIGGVVLVGLGAIMVQLK